MVACQVSAFVSVKPMDIGNNTLESFPTTLVTTKPDVFFETSGQFPAEDQVFLLRCQDNLQLEKQVFLKRCLVNLQQKTWYL